MWRIFILEFPIKKQMRSARRLATIVNVFARYGYWSFIKKARINSDLTDEEHAVADALSTSDSSDQVFHLTPAVRLRMAFEELGPAFVKLGQILAVREDLLPIDITSELQKLHSHVESVPYALIEERLVSELGPEKLKQFSEISKVSLAAGSMAQVHRAKLVSGEEVVIKIQRPQISEQIATDLSLIESFARLAEKYFPEFRFFRPAAMTQALAQAILAELDFVREAGATTKVAKNFAADPEIVIPKVYWDLTTEKVLTLSYLDGIPSLDRERMIQMGLDPASLVETGMKMFLKMVFRDGLFHGDLHPGNLMALTDGKVAVIDFGLTVKISKWTRENLAALLLAMVQEDYERMVHHFLEIAEPASNLNPVQLQNEIANRLSPIMGLRLKHINNSKILWDVAKIAAKYETPLPQDLIVFIKTLAAFEGLGNKLHPDFDPLKLCEEFSKDIVHDLYSTKNIQMQITHITRDFANLARHAPILLRKLLLTANEGQLKIQVASEDVLKNAKAVDRSSSRISISIIIAALLLGSSVLTAFKSAGEHPFQSIIGSVGFSLAGVLGLYVIFSILRGGKL